MQRETPETCVERFNRVIVSDVAIPADTRFLPVFTYDVTKVENVFEAFGRDEANPSGMHLTFAQGGGEEAVRAFYEAEVPKQGAFFARDDISLFRMSGIPATRDETILAGCRAAPPKARLINIQWTAP